MRTVRAAFTLLELTVAITVGSLVVIAGHALYDAALTLDTRVVARISAVASEGIAVEALSDALAMSRGTADVPFSGTSVRLDFDGGCRDAYGGTGRCHVTVSALPKLALRESWPTGAIRELVARDVAGTFDYVADASDGGATVSAWRSTTALPLAVRWTPSDPSQLRADTLIFAILRSLP